MTGEPDIIPLTAEGQRRFVEALLRPMPFAPALERARDAHARLIVHDR